MIRFLKWALAAGLLLVAQPVLAQSTATPVVLGYLTTSGCPAGQTSCFVQYGTPLPTNTSVSVTVAALSPLAVTTTDKGGTITSGGTAQAAIALNASRKGWCIQNDPAATETLYVRVNGTASATTGAPLVPGGGACSIQGLIDTAAVSVFAATTGHRWYGSEAQ